MKKNLYFREVMKRENILKNKFLDFFLGVASFPRLLLEVFTRRNMGERYFSFASAMTVGVIIAFFPLLMYEISSFISDPFGTVVGHGATPFGNSSPFGMSPFQNPNLGSTSLSQNPYGSNIPVPDNPNHNFGLHYITWYIFLAVFLTFANKRNEEIKRLPSVFDFARYSLSSGIINPMFFRVNRAGKQPDIRRVETLYEPAPFFIGGIILWMMGQSLGWLLVLSSVCYALSYMGAYRRGDDFVMDKIDEQIVNEELEDAFVQDENPENTRGVRFFARRPSSEEMRRKVAESFVEEDDDAYVVK